MLRNATMILAMGLLLVGAASAQTAVTVAQINEIPQANIDQLNALGDAVTGSDTNNCGSLIYNDLCGQEVTFTAVVMSDPLNSGLASVGSDGRPGRIHIFVRDVATDTDGPEGQGIQIVDGSNNLGFDGLVVGDVIEVTGSISPFFTTIQVSPSASPNVVGFRDPATDPIFAPIAVVTSDINADVGPDGAIRVNWDNLASMRGSYVRFEGATAVTRTSGSRVDWNWTSDGGGSSVAMYDTSLRFRNDKSDYPDNYNRRSSRDPYEAPVPGAKVNVQGFVTFNGVTSSDPFNLAVPNGMALAVNPMNDEDVVVTESPPTISDLRPSVIPGSATGATLTPSIEADPARSIASVAVNYTLADGTTGTVSETSVDGTTYTFVIPADGLNDGDFISYAVSATDNTGATSDSDTFSLRVLDDGINEIADVQLTLDEGPGSSPFVDMSVDTDITATVQVAASAGFMTLQDSQNGWSGVVIDRADDNAALAALSAGDVINVTHLKVEENFGLTRLDETDIAFTVVSTGGATIEPVVVTTDMMQDSAIAEAHEGMVLEVAAPIIVSTNSDAPSGPFGEFSISSDGDPANSLRVDDASDLWVLPSNDPGQVYSVWERLEFVRGTLWYSFGNYKLEPYDENDVGAVTNTALEAGELPESVVLHQNYPNPFNPTTEIQFELASGADVRLEVFDLLGRRVRLLASGTFTPGTHSVTFGAQGLSTGVYTYRLTTGAVTQVRTMLLMK